MNCPLHSKIVHYSKPPIKNTISFSVSSTPAWCARASSRSVSIATEKPCVKNQKKKISFLSYREIFSVVIIMIMLLDNTQVCMCIKYLVISLETFYNSILFTFND